MVLVLVRVLLLLLSMPFVHWCCRAASDDDGYGHHDADGYDLRRQSIHIMIIVVMVAILMTTMMMMTLRPSSLLEVLSFFVLVAMCCLGLRVPNSVCRH